MATLQALRQDLFELVGRNTELDPADPDGRSILDRYLRRAYEFVLSLRLPRGGRLSSSVYQLSPVFFQISPFTGQAVSGDASSIQLAGAFSAPEWLLPGYAIKLTSGTGSGQFRIITAYNALSQTATVFPAWDTIPDSTTGYLLTSRRVPIVSSPQTNCVVIPSSPNRLIDIVRLTQIKKDSEERFELKRLPQIDESSRLELGDPDYYALQGSVLLFDKAPEETVQIEALCRLMPEFPIQEDVEVYLPAPFEQLLILHARWWILIRYGEIQDAYAAKKDFYDFWATLSSPGEDAFSWEDSGTVRLY